MKHEHRWLIGALLAVVPAAMLVLITPGPQSSLAADSTIYVDAGATGADTGKSWLDAFTDLQSALDVATSGSQIWVAEGIYKPLVERGGSGDRYRSFQLMNGVALYGGFAGTEGSLGERDWVLHETILSGDLNGNDGPNFENNDENSYHVFYHPQGTGLDASAILDGFVISGGNANYEPPHYWGGGMHNAYSSPALANCTFRGNWAGFDGGGMYNSYASPVLTNCVFSDNSAWYGGGMSNAYSAPGLTDCTFSDNTAGYGGGMWNVSSTPVLTNCAFAGNSASTHGGGMRNIYSSPALTNCTFEGNSAEHNGGGMYNESSSPTLTNCSFWGNSAEANGGGMWNGWGSSPTLTNTILWADTPEEIYSDEAESSPVVSYSNVQGGYAGEGNLAAYPWFVDPMGGDFHLGPCSPCIDQGNNLAADLPDYDFEGDDRILDGDGDGTATVDMGVDEVAVAGSCVRLYLPVVPSSY